VLVLGLASVSGIAKPAGAASPNAQSLVGRVESAGSGLPGYGVTLYASSVQGSPSWRVLGSAPTDGAGAFAIDYRLPAGKPADLQPVLVVLAESGRSMLAGAIGRGPAVGHPVVVNERTTVATATAFAQFIDGSSIVGNRYGMINAVPMAANMANPETGLVGEVLDRSPNAEDTSTRRTFNSLSNMVAACVADDARCGDLFDDATPMGGATPDSVLQAIANSTRFAGSVDVGGLFALSQQAPVHGPALEIAPFSWLLFLKFTGGFYSEFDSTNLMSGPGNVAFDREGFAWMNDNYVPTDFTVPPDTTDLAQISCAGLRVMKFTPAGASVPGSPFFGGGLSGAGFGITIDRKERIWVANYGFEAPACADGTVPGDPEQKVPATHDSLSAFLSDGTVLSGPDGFTDGHIWWPQGIVSDPLGDLWVASCGNDTVTRLPKGRPQQAQNIAIPGGLGALGDFRPHSVDDSTDPRRPRIKPFGVAVDPQGRAWVTGNAAGFGPDYETTDHVGGVYRIERDGSVETIATPEDELVSWPMGIYGDSQGNMWVSSSDAVNVPCVTPLDPRGGSIGPSVVFFPADGGPGERYVGGGLSIPWGNVVDGNDTVWVFNFGHNPTDAVDADTTWPDTAVSHFCGADPSRCPPAAAARGAAISPPQGYVSDALERITGGGVDSVGNLWLLNNWKKEGAFGPVYNTNPGGNSFVIVPGAAAPVETPVVGPPRGLR
jgi:hypothetical protein